MQVQYFLFLFLLSPLSFKEQNQKQEQQQQLQTRGGACQACTTPHPLPHLPSSISGHCPWIPTFCACVCVMLRGGSDAEVHVSPPGAAGCPWVIVTGMGV